MSRICTIETDELIVTIEVEGEAFSKESTLMVGQTIQQAAKGEYEVEIKGKLIQCIDKKRNIQIFPTPNEQKSQ